MKEQHDVVYGDRHLELAVCELPQSLAACKYLVSLGCQPTDEACDEAIRSGSHAVLQYFVEIRAVDGDVLPQDWCAIAASRDSIDTLKYLHEELQCPWNPLDVAVAFLSYARNDSSVLQYLYDQGEVFTDEQLTELLKDSITHVTQASNLISAKWLRDHSADWPAVLECFHVDENYDSLRQDWPEVAVRWCRAEGCTAPLWSGKTYEANDCNCSDADVKCDSQHCGGSSSSS